MTQSETKVKHGVNCKKEPHVRDGYLHGEGDDSPYSVDGLMYCGRCHAALDEHHANCAVNPTHMHAPTCEKLRGLDCTCLPTPIPGAF